MVAAKITGPSLYKRQDLLCCDPISDYSPVDLPYNRKSSQAIWIWAGSLNVTRTTALKKMVGCFEQAP